MNDAYEQIITRKWGTDQYLNGLLTGIELTLFVIHSFNIVRGISKRLSVK